MYALDVLELFRVDRYFPLSLSLSLSFSELERILLSSRNSLGYLSEQNAYVRLLANQVDPLSEMIDDFERDFIEGSDDERSGRKETGRSSCPLLIFIRFPYCLLFAYWTVTVLSRYL